MHRSSVGIVGGGLVGAAAALCLARLGFTVTLIDRKKPQLNRGRLGLDIRNVALSPASRAILETAGIWGDTPAAAYTHMCVWEQWGNSQLDFDAADVGRTELGWLLEMSPLVCRAWQQMEAHPDISLSLAAIAGVQAGADSVALEFDDATVQQFDFLIAADGAQSVVRRALDVGVAEYPVEQVALATVVRTERSHQHTAWQRFLSDGPLAFLPAPDEHLCSIVWSQSPAAAEQRREQAADIFCRDIGHAIEHRLGEVLDVDQRLTFPLTQQRVKHCAPHPRVLLVGDAMRVVHPLAGLGVNLGLEDVRGLVQVAANHADLAAPGIWARYARERLARAQMMIRTMGGLQQLFGSAHPAVSLLRNFGVQSFNALDGVKRQVMQEAMGLGRLSAGQEHT